jgi:hypothetical protein
MHSWRVLILPFLEQSEVYSAYNFSEPWNGPNNAKLADRVGSIFRRPEASGSRFIDFVAVVGNDTVFPGDRSLALGEIKDGTSRTIMFAEIAHSDIPWMEPRDLMLEQMTFRVNASDGRGIGSYYQDVRVAMVDGSVRVLKESIKADRLRALLTANGGEVLDKDPF